MNFFIYFDLRSCVYLLLKNFHWTLYSSFYFLLCCFVCFFFFFAGDSWENVFRRSYWSGAVRRRLPIGSTVLAPWTAYLFSASFFLSVSVLLCIVGAATQKQQNKKNREIESKKNNTSLPPPPTKKIGGGGVRGGGGMHSHNIYRDDYWSGREKWRPTMAAL